ncbi:S49 family peptidase [Terriglobus albidus]|uniref:S49 family peptidase n=1 Tax=Terriglobus albidus TaxID=1592106 RepID=UPI0021DF7F7B|nr:S49 family peptidase [Terriglobus albidus]
MGKVRIFSPYEKPLALTPWKLTQICDVWDRHQAGVKIDASSLKAEFGSEAEDLPTRFFAAGANITRRTADETGGAGYVIRDGVALIAIEGVLGKRMDIFMWFSGGTSTEDLQKDVIAAVNDSAVTAICYVVDSPGGDVDGTQLAANVIQAAAEKKPSAAWVTGLGASAAYWLASQTSVIYLADDTTTVGSIGVVYQHVDRSGADQQRGVKRTEITAGKYKRIASDTGPLTQEGTDYIKEGVDHVYSVFVDNVADGRGVSSDQVLTDMADGRVFMGQKAIDAGLADGIATLDQVITMLNDGKVQKVSNTAASASETLNTGEAAMQYTQEQYDAAVKTAREEGHAAGVAEGTKNGAAAELARIKGVSEQALPGHQTLIQTLMFDGQTSAGEAAIKVNAAEREARKKAGEDMHNDAPTPAPGAVVPTVTAPAPEQPSTPENADAKDPQVLADKASAYQAEQAKAGNKISLSEAVEHVSKQK